MQEIRICFVPNGSVSAFFEGGMYASKGCIAGEGCFEKKGANLILFGFNGIGEVSYERELKGESGFFERVGLLSKAESAVVVCGCVTDMRGHKRKSALVAENGRLVGVSDMIYVADREVACGGALRVYDTGIGRMGVAVAEDVYTTDVVKSLTLCGSDFIVCPFGRCENEMQSVLLRAHAYTYGIPIIFCGVGYCMMINGEGKMCFASPNTETIVFKDEVGYHLIETRRKGKGI